MEIKLYVLIWSDALNLSFNNI